MSCENCLLIDSEIKMKDESQNNFELKFSDFLDFFLNMNIEMIEQYMVDIEEIGNDNYKYESKFYILAVLQKFFKSHVNAGARRLSYFRSGCSSESCPAMFDSIYVFNSEQSPTYECGVKFKRVGTKKFEVAFCFYFMNKDKTSRGDYYSLMYNMALTRLEIDSR